MADSKPATNEVTMDRRADDRRDGKERRQQGVGANEDRRQGDRRKVQRRRQIDPTTCERDYSNDEIEFMQALDEYKRRNGRMFPTCSEILEVIRDLGYVKTNTTAGAGQQARERAKNLNEFDARDKTSGDALEVEK